MTVIRTPVCFIGERGHYVRMAQRVHVILEDDIDGSEAAGTVQFGLDGTSYEIDLNETHAARLRKALAPYVDKARKTSTAKKSGRKRDGDGRAAEIRQWARDHGHDVPARGRIPRDVREAYEAA